MERGGGFEPPSVPTLFVSLMSPFTSCIYFWLCNRHNPTLLQPRGSGSHLLLANRHTLRVRVFVGKVLLALVGFPFFRVAFSLSLSLLYHKPFGLSRPFLKKFQSVEVGNCTQFLTKAPYSQPKFCVRDHSTWLSHFQGGYRGTFLALSTFTL